MTQLIQRARGWAGFQVASRRPAGRRERLYRAFLQDLIRKTDNFGDLTWLGQPIWQNVLDLWSLQEAIVEIRPGVLLETGTNRGGSALFYAHLFDLLGHGRVVTVDVESMHSLEHPRVDFLVGGSVDPEIRAAMHEAADATNGPVMVVLDSDHAAAHVLEELRAYGPLVSPGSMMLVQDGVIDTLPMYAAYRPGPLAAIQTYLAEAPEFDVDGRFDRRFLVTHHPSGWLRRRPA
jgi:cephalosporin hydroxylase